MKKLVLAALVGGIGFALYKKVGSGKSGQELWSTVTDKVH